jgi:ubiquitin C
MEHCCFKGVLLPIAETVSIVPNMQIFVKTLTGNSVVLNVKRSDTIETVKRKIENWDGIPSPLFGLVFAGPGQIMSRQMVDQRTIGDYNVDKESTLYSVSRLRSEVKPSLCIKIFIQISVLKTVETWLEMSTRIGSLKLKIHEIEGIPVEEQILFCFGTELQDDCSLACYPIFKEQTIRLRRKVIFTIASTTRAQSTYNQGVLDRPSPERRPPTYSLNSDRNLPPS